MHGELGGGGGDDGPYLQRVWVMNVNPEFPSANVSVGSTLIGAGLLTAGLGWSGLALALALPISGAVAGATFHAFTQRGC